MQTQNANAKGFRAVFRNVIRSVFERVLPKFQAVRAPEVKVSIADAPATRVVTKTQTAVISAPVRAKRTDFFKRTADEIGRGLTIEQAKAERVSAATPQTETKLVAQVSVTQPAKRGEDKAKRFRRSTEEIRLGLSREEAMLRRGVEVAAPAVKKIYVERPAAPAKPAQSGDLIETLSPRIQLRARAVSSYRAKGHQGVITAEMLDLVERAVKEGKVTKCEPFVGSDGFNHFTQEEAK
jgi:hypothetical protein